MEDASALAAACLFGHREVAERLIYHGVSPSSLPNVRLLHHYVHAARLCALQVHPLKPKLQLLTLCSLLRAL